MDKSGKTLPRTPFSNAAGQMLCFFQELTGQQAEQLAVALPIRPREELTEAYREWRIAAEHIRNVVRVVFVHVFDQQVELLTHGVECLDALGEKQSGTFDVVDHTEVFQTVSL